MRERFHEYVEWCRENPIMEARMSTTDTNFGTLAYVPKKRPLSLKGFCLFLGRSASWFSTLESRVNAANNSSDKGYREAMRYIKDFVQNDVYEGAMAGIYKEQMSIRILGLEDKRRNDFHVTAVAAPKVSIVMSKDAPKLASSEEQIMLNEGLLENRIEDLEFEENFDEYEG